MYRIFILTLVCGLVACGNDSERSFSVQKEAAQATQPAQQLPSELVQLVPADASVFVCIRSFDAAQMSPMLRCPSWTWRVSHWGQMQLA